MSNLHHSRRVAIEKMINVIHKMSEHSLWLTYRKTEQVTDQMSTPRSRSIKPHSFLRRKSNPLLNSSASKNPYLSASKSSVGNRQLDKSVEIRRYTETSKPSPRGSTRMMTMPGNTSPTRKSMVPDKYTITTNNRVEPNFQSMTYQEEARMAHKRRMNYNPMEASKNKLQVTSRPGRFEDPNKFTD